MNYEMLFDDTLVWGALERMWLAPFFVVAAAAVIFGYITYRRRLKVLAHALHVRSMLPGYAPWRGATKLVLLLVAIVSLFLALLQPQWGRKEVSVQQEGRDILIALDISRSMQAKDVKPSRLSFVKLKIRKLLDKLSFERVGLILFSGSAFVQCPLTADYKTFLMFLEHVNTETISSGTTAIGTAVTKASEVFKRSKNRKNKLVLLITDGEDFVSNTKRIADQVRREGVTVLSWGVGTLEGAPVPLYDAYGRQQGHAKHKDGSLATSKLNEELLKDVSESIGGSYERVMQDDGDIVRIAEKLDQYEREHFDERNMSAYHDQYPWLLFVTWVCLAMEWLL